MTRTNNATLIAQVEAHQKALAETLPRRQKVLETRLNHNKELLREDIEMWSGDIERQLPNTPISFHVRQFAGFWKAAYDCLEDHYQRANNLPGEDRTLFEMEIISSLTSQWVVLRAVAAQRLPGHPYAEKLKDLDTNMERQYRRMRRALAEAGVEQAKEWPLPLLYLGRLAEVALPDKRQAPAIVSIPFGAAHSDAEAQPIAHELGHLPGRRIDGLLNQMVEPARAALRDYNSHYASVLEELIFPWLGEIVADLFGTALAGAPLVISGIELMTAPERLVNLTDREHPVALIRPYIHLELLKYLKDEQDQKAVRDHLVQYLEEGVARKTAEACLDKLTTALFSRRLELSDKLVPLTLKAIKEATIAVVVCILDAPLTALGNKTLGEVLKRCADRSQADGDENKPALLDWGALSKEECKTFVLPRPSSANQEWPGPILRNVIDDWVGWLQGALGTEPPPPPPPPPQ